MGFKGLKKRSKHGAAAAAARRGEADKGSTLIRFLLMFRSSSDNLKTTSRPVF